MTVTKIVITIAATWMLVLAPTSHATTDVCQGHMDQKDAAFGYASPGADPKFVSACDGDSGPDAFNNAQTPDTASHPDARKPLTPRAIDSGHYDETQGIPDEDGLQAQDVRPSPMFVP